MLYLNPEPDCDVCSRAAARTQAAADQVAEVLKTLEAEQAAFVSLYFAHCAIAESPYRACDLETLERMSEGAVTLHDLLEGLVRKVADDIGGEAHKRAGDL